MAWHLGHAPICGFFASGVLLEEGEVIGRARFSETYFDDAKSQIKMIWGIFPNL